MGSYLNRYQTLVIGRPTILYYILLEDVAWQSHDQSMNKLVLVDSPQHVVNFLCIYTCYSYDSHIYVLSSYTSVVSLTYVFLNLHMAPYLQFMQFSLPAWRYSHCQMMTSCLGSHADISGQYWVMVNTAKRFVVKLSTTATAATMTTTSWISC